MLLNGGSEYLYGYGYSTIAMPTTVQVSEETRKLLDGLKRELGLKSYDEVIKKLVKSKHGMPGSLFGACRGSLPFRREPEAEHEL